MNNRYSRQNFLGESSASIFGRAVVGVVGLGGAGSHIVQQLAHIGIKHFVIADSQEIEDTNLNRLVGAEAHDIEQKTQKVDIAERMILRLHPDARVTKVKDKWQAGHLSFRECDVIFGCVDSVDAKNQLERFARRFLIPYIDIGMDVFLVGDEYMMTGQVARSIPGEPCLWCLNIINEDNLTAEARKYGAAGGRPQVVWPNGALASAAIGLFVEILSPWHPIARPVACLDYDGNSNTLTSSNRFFSPTIVDGQCPHHSLSDVGDPFFKLSS